MTKLEIAEAEEQRKQAERNAVASAEQRVQDTLKRMREGSA